MRPPFLTGLLACAGFGYALPQDGGSGCVTVTTEIIIPTATATYTTTEKTTVYATTAEDLGTFTYVTTLSGTTTLETVTSWETVCAGGSSGVPSASTTSTVYTTQSTSAPSSPPGSYRKRALGLSPRQQDAGCTTTSTSTTIYGATYTFVAAPNQTSTFTQYSAFTQATVTSTKTGGRAYTIASTTATITTDDCTQATQTTTQDARCVPSALTSAYNNYGLSYAADVPAAGAVHSTNTTDASACCQLCATSWECAASVWDSRTGSCRLEFPVDFESGELNCGEGALVYYDAGPDSPMAPGTGLWVAGLCGEVEFGSAKPDDGT